MTDFPSNTAGTCMDATCCRAKLPEHQCRCNISERLHQFARIQQVGKKELSTSAALAVFAEQLRILRFMVVACDGEPFASPVCKFSDKLAQFICGGKEGEATRTEPFKPHELDLVREMDRLAGIPWP